MLKEQTLLRPELLEEIVQRILRVTQPKRVILFGSAARGQATQESDLDILVIVPTGPLHRRTLAQDIYHNLRGILTPVDIVVATEEDVQKHGQAIGSILRPALKEGRVIYDSKQP